MDPRLGDVIQLVADAASPKLIAPARLSLYPETTHVWLAQSASTAKYVSLDANICWCPNSVQETRDREWRMRTGEKRKRRRRRRKGEAKKEENARACEMVFTKVVQILLSLLQKIKVNIENLERMKTGDAEDPVEFVQRRERLLNEAHSFRSSTKEKLLRLLIDMCTD